MIWFDSSAVLPVVGGVIIGWSLAHVYRLLVTRKRGTLVSTERRRDNKIKVYHTRTFRSARVAWLVEELGVQEDFEFIPYNPYTAADGEKEWYKQHVHPHGTVPALVDTIRNKSIVILESAAICLYLAELYNELLPTPDNVHVYYDWIIYGASTLDDLLYTFEDILEQPPSNQDQGTLDAAFSKADNFARYFEHHLEDRDFICGAQLTTADVVVGYCVMWASVIKGGKILSGYPRVKAYLDRLKARPAFSKTIGTPREWIQTGASGLKL